MAKKKSKPNTIDIPSIKVDSFTNEEDNIELTSINNPYSISMYLQSNTDPKYFSKFIKRVERVIRTNKDYEEYLTYLRDDKNLNYCSIFHNISAGEASIELHHFPFTLYTLCSITASRMLTEGLKVSTFTVADEVIKLHFREVVGLVPLTKTIHELAHLGKVTLLKKMIYGNYMEFFNENREFFTVGEVEFIDKLNELEYLKIDNNLIGLLEVQGK
jgi:hypothetical protein